MGEFYARLWSLWMDLRTKPVQQTRTPDADQVCIPGSGLFPRHLVGMIETLRIRCMGGTHGHLECFISQATVVVSAQRRRPILR